VKPRHVPEEWRSQVSKLFNNRGAQTVSSSFHRHPKRIYWFWDLHTVCGLGWLTTFRGSSLQLTFEDESDKDFQNVVVVVSHPEPHTLDKPKNQEI
jgi:hypothetical protein